MGKKVKDAKYLTVANALQKLELRDIDFKLEVLRKRRRRLMDKLNAKLRYQRKKERRDAGKSN